MKTTKFFVSTLIAAAAMTATAYSDIVTSPTWTWSLGADGDFVATTTISGGFDFDLGDLAVTNGESFKLSVFQTATSWGNENGTGIVGTADPYGVDASNNNFRVYVGNSNNGEKVLINVNGWSYGNGGSTSVHEFLTAYPETPSKETPLKFGFSFQYVNEKDTPNGNNYFVFSSLPGSQFSFEPAKDYNVVRTFNFSHLQNTSTIVEGVPADVSTTISMSKQSVATARGASFSLENMTLTDGTAGNLVWAGTEVGNAWNYSTDNKNWSMSSSATSFMKGDNVTFTSTADKKTVSLEDGAALVVGNMTVESGEYSLILGTDGRAVVSGEKLTIKQGASLTLGDKGNNVVRKVALDFAQISLGGSIKFKTTGAHSWSSLTFEEGGNLHFIDGTGGQSEPHLSISTVDVAGNATISAAADKNFAIGTLSGSGSLSVTGSSNWGALGISIGDLSGYTGVATFNKGVYGLTVNLTGNTAVNSAAKLVFNNGVTINNTGTLTLDGEIVLSGTINNTGTVSVSDSVKIDIGQMTASDNVYTIVSGGNINESWSSLTSSNFLQNGGALGRGTFSNEGTHGTITFVSESAKPLTWNGGASGTWDYNSSQSWKDSSDAAETFYTKDSVDFNTAGAEITVVGVVVPDNMTVSANTTFTGIGYHISAYKLSLDDEKTLKIVGGTLELTGEGQSDFKGIINIGESGTLKLTAHDAFQWTNDGAINLEGSEGKVAKLVVADPRSLTMKKSLNLKGYAEIASENNGVFNSWDGLVISAENKNNVISGRVQVRQNGLTLSVADKGELLVSGVVETNTGNGTNPSFSKVGKGSLTLSGENTFSNDFAIKEGIVVAASTSALGSGNVTVKSGATLKLAVAVENVGNVSLEEGAMFAIDVTGMSPVSMMANGNETVALSILSSSALSFNGQDASSLISSDTIDGYFDDKNSNLGQWSEWQREWSYSDGTLSLTLTIPEPSAFGLLAGVGALALCVSRRRRVKKA